MVTEGRASSGGRRELFAPGSVSWPSEGVGIQTFATTGTSRCGRSQFATQDGRIEVRAEATDGIRAAIAEGRKWLSVEFVALEERTTKGGVREILRALVPFAALVRLTRSTTQLPRSCGARSGGGSGYDRGRSH